MTDSTNDMTDTRGSRGPRVLAPPPVLFVAALAASWWLDGRLNFEIDGAGAGTFQMVLGVAAIAGGFCLSLWGVATFARAHTPVLPNRPARLLVVSGPYRFTRNPIYLGLTATYFGVALVFNSAWPLVLLPVVLGLLTVLVINREERYLSSAFGADYERYRQRVRRWL